VRTKKDLKPSATVHREEGALTIVVVMAFAGGERRPGSYKRRQPDGAVSMKSAGGYYFRPAAGQAIGRLHTRFKVCSQRAQGA
jgi:hypothetical protein